MSARFALRSATSAAHERLDSLFSTFDLKDRDGYGRFLQAQAGAFLAVEAALDGPAGEILADWPQRKRSDALRRDLSGMNLAMPGPVETPAFAGLAAALGGLYVLEGSRLGGALLLRSVPEDFPRSFLEPGNPSAWRAFVAVLDQRLSSPESLDAAAASAAAVFQAFETSANRVLGADRS